MASSRPDRSIGSSYLPQWMKSKINDRYDLEQTMAFSPPNNDDGFFILKHRRHEEPTTTPKPKIVEPKFTPKLQTFDESPTSTPPVNQFVVTDPTPREVGMRLPGEQALTKIKSSSSSSEDKEIPPPFGHSSIVAVAHQMIADTKNHDLQADPNPHRLRVRRNSKSLPTSPQTSPKMFRKNPFFTNIFFGSSELVNVAEETKTVSRTASTDACVESWSSKVVRAFTESEAPTPPVKSPPPVKALKAKPSELREMNFWSPTSM